MNIKFCYRYRDYGNNKNYNEIIFENPKNKSIGTIRNRVESNLFDDRFFYSTEWKVPDLHFEGWDPDLDHFVHEFDSVEETEALSNIEFNLEEFIFNIENARNYWILKKIFFATSPPWIV